MTFIKKIHKIDCQDPWFSLIRCGKKSVEGRKNSPKYRDIKVGEHIEFICGNRRFFALVTAIQKFDSLENYLQTVTLEKALPGILTMEEAIRIYLQWSTQDEISRWGFLGIFVTPKE